MPQTPVGSTAMNVNLPRLVFRLIFFLNALIPNIYFILACSGPFLVIKKNYEKLNFRDIGIGQKSQK